MTVSEILNRVREAFADVPYPGDENIIHCVYDRRWGGSQDGPCRECAEVITFFRGAGNSALDPEQLDWRAFGLASFTPNAFRFWLPAFIEAALLHPDECGHVQESLEFRFESEERRDQQRGHFGALSEAQFDAVAIYFKYLLSVPGESVESINDILRNIEAWRRSAGPNKGVEPTPETRRGSR